MKTAVFLMVVVLVGFFVMTAMAKRKREGVPKPSGKEISGPAPYFGKTPLSEPEQVLFHRLREALPEQIVLAQVAMNALVGIRKNPNWQSQFNEISRKYVDFVVCLPDFSVVAVVELDDTSHQRGDRIKSDAIKDAAFQLIKYPVIRFHVSDMPNVEKIREAIGL